MSYADIRRRSYSSFAENDLEPRDMGIRFGRRRARCQMISGRGPRHTPVEPYSPHGRTSAKFPQSVIVDSACARRVFTNCSTEYKTFLEDYTSSNDNTSLAGQERKLSAWGASRGIDYKATVLGRLNVLLAGRNKTPGRAAQIDGF